MFATTNDQEIYSTASTMYPFYHNQYSQLQQHDAKSIVLQQPTTLYSSSPAESANEMHSRMRGQWMKRVAEWIAQTQGSNPKLDSIPEATEEPSYPCEEILYVASPPGATTSPYSYAGSAFTTSSSTSSNSWSSAKSLRRLSHGRTCSLESISEEAEE